MDRLKSLESQFANEVLWRFCSSQEELNRKLMSRFGTIRFDARLGAIVVECSNPFVFQTLNSRRRQMDSIAELLGTHLRIVFRDR